MAKASDHALCLHSPCPPRAPTGAHGNLLSTNKLYIHWKYIHKALVLPDIFLKIVA